MSHAIPYLGSAIPFPAISKWRLRYISFVATGLVVMGILCNVIFYSEFGQGFSSLAYAVIGLLLDLSKIVVIGLFVLFVIDFERHVTETSLCIAAWLVLSVLSLAAAYGFLSQVNERYENEKLKASNVYAQHEDAVRRATQEADKLSQYSGTNAPAVQAQIDRLNTERAGLESKLSDCPANWYTKCINPTQAKINQVNGQLTTLRSKLAQNESYQRAVARKQAALSEFTALDVVGSVQYHPLFVNVGSMTNAEPRNVKAAFILLTSLVVELLASVLFFLKARLTNIQFYAQGMVYTQTQPHIQGTHAPQISPQTSLKDPVQPPHTSVYADHTQGVPANHTQNIPAVTTHAQGMPIVTDPYTRLKQMVQSGSLTNLSYNTIRDALGVNNAQAKTLRQQLVDDRLAVFDHTNKCLPIGSLSSV